MSTQQGVGGGREKEVTVLDGFEGATNVASQGVERSRTDEALGRGVVSWKRVKEGEEMGEQGRAEKEKGGGGGVPRRE